MLDTIYSGQPVPFRAQPSVQTQFTQPEAALLSAIVGFPMLFSKNSVAVAVGGALLGLALTYAFSQLPPQ